VRVLVVNAGSSSLKVRLLDSDDALLGHLDLPPPRPGADDAGLIDALAGLGAVDAIGHRIVHGGQRFRQAVRVDADVVAELEALTDLAPLHQPGSLAALELVGRALPGVTSVACFDTAFHVTIPPAAATYALPAAWRERWALRRYGFHGLSHAYAARRAGEMLEAAGADLRVVTCHLGAGASLTAVLGGRSVDTTMGFTPLEGLVMATRSGSVDPGLLLWLTQRKGLSTAELGDALEHASGLTGLAGTADMRALLARVEAGEETARLALDVYVHRLRAGIGAMTTSLGGIDALVFTGGVGERAPAVRAAAVEQLGYLGFRLDPERNRSADGDADLSAPEARARVLLVHAREDLEIARQVRAALEAQPAAAAHGAAGPARAREARRARSS
jgi:acetate kinase